ncbi:AzlC family ABC transporter permease [Brevibacillus sp. NPDC003359]
MALAAGLTTWDSVAMSLFVYTGAAQYSAIAMIAENTGMWAIISPPDAPTSTMAAPVIASKPRAISSGIMIAM